MNTLVNLAETQAPEFIGRTRYSRGSRRGILTNRTVRLPANIARQKSSHERTSHSIQTHVRPRAKEAGRKEVFWGVGAGTGNRVTGNAIPAQLTPLNWALLEKPPVAQLLKSPSTFFGTRRLITRSQEPWSGTYPGPDQFSPYHAILSLSDAF
jgi:hypothetical protein